MSPKQLIFHDAARDKIRHAAESLAVAVINTLHKERELATQVRHLFAKIWVLPTHTANKFNHLRLFLTHK
jgi:hypothetical protein